MKHHSQTERKTMTVAIRPHRRSENFCGDRNQFEVIYRVLKNNVYNVSGMIEEVKTNMFFIRQNFGLCTVFPLDGL